jgi:transposase
MVMGVCRKEDGARCLANRRMEAGDREAIRRAGFEVLPKRWIVERTFAWISRNRRPARDFAFIRLAMIRIMLRRLAANTSS